PMPVRIKKGVHDSVSIHRGPLVYSLRIADDRRVVGRPAPGFVEFEQTPRSAWNYALSLDAKDPGKSVELLVDAPSDARPDTNPFAPAITPVKLTFKARKVPQWGLAWNSVVAFDPPASPVQ